MSLRINFAPSQPASRPRLLGLSIGTATLVLFCALAWTMTGETEAGFPLRQENVPGEEKNLSLNKAIDDLNFPWLNILALLEENTSPELRLGQMEVDTRSARLNLQGEARDSRAVHSLPANLKRNLLVSDVRIVSQSTASADENMAYPTRFALEIQFSLPEGR